MLVFYTYVRSVQGTYPHKEKVLEWSEDLGCRVREENDAGFEFEKGWGLGLTHALRFRFATPGKLQIFPKLLPPMQLLWFGPQL